MSQDDYQASAKLFNSEFDAADLRWSYDISRYANDKKIAQALVKDYLGWYARIGASDNDGFGELTHQ